MRQPQTSYDHFSDPELYSLVQHEDASAFEALYKRYWPELIDAAYKRLQSRQKAEDIVQEIFISLYTKRGTVEFTVSLRAYLRQALKFKILNEFRSESVRSAYAQSPFFKEICKNDFAEKLDAKELDQNIHSLLQQLPGKCRQVFELSRKEHKTNKEIAAELNISPSTVEKHIGKALNILRNQLKPYAYSC